MTPGLGQPGLVSAETGQLGLVRAPLLPEGKWRKSRARPESLTGGWYYPDIIMRVIRGCCAASITCPGPQWPWLPGPQWARQYSAQLVPCRALRSPQNTLIRLRRLLTPNTGDTFPGSRWRLAHGGVWAELTLPPVTVRLLDILDMGQARQKSLLSPPYPGQARPRSARSDKVRPILLMRSWWPGISLDPAPYSQVLTYARSEHRAHHLRPAGCTYLTWTLKDRGVSDH